MRSVGGEGRGEAVGEAAEAIFGAVPGEAACEGGEIGLHLVELGTDQQPKGHGVEDFRWEQNVGWVGLGAAGSGSAFVGSGRASIELALSPQALVPQAPFDGTGGRSRAASGPGDDQGPGHQAADLLPSVFQVAGLVAGSLAGDQQPAPGVTPTGRQCLEPSPGGVVEAGDAVQVDPQLDLRRNLVDVLASRPGGPDGTPRDRS